MFRRRTQPCATTTEEPEPPELDLEARLDERLIQNAQQGDLPSFNTLVTRHQRSVYNVCLRMLRDSALAEDAAQDTFIKAWTSIGTFRGGLVRPWLLRIATNRCYDILRSQGRRPASSLDAELVESEPQWTSQTAIAEHPEGHATRRELSAFLERALGELPDDQRLAIILSDVQGHSYDEIAQITEVAVGTVKSRIFRARARLRELVLSETNAREHLERYQRLVNSANQESAG
ncbi:MAG TPA: sigma-70 family RNA polymerase sigma factor [Thermomicrobiales bacterium]|jgi:RNA polymerase sigma-70 factor (ECF subfamily)|nr:sigma-70 family RNA polymerase sigma factor [Thermomicrobiales bacterium]